MAVTSLTALPERALCVVSEFLGSKGSLNLRLLSKAIYERLTDECPGLWHLVLKKGRLLATFEAARNLLDSNKPPDRRTFITNTYFETRRWRTLPVSETRCCILPVKQYTAVAINDPRSCIDAAGSRSTAIAKGVVVSFGATANVQDRMRSHSRIMTLCDRPVSQTIHFPIIMEPRPLRHRQLFIFWPFRTDNDSWTLYANLELTPIDTLPLGHTLSALPPALAAPLTPPYNLKTTETAWAVPVDESGSAKTYKHILLLNWASVLMPNPKAENDSAVFCRICAHDLHENAASLGPASAIFNFPIADANDENLATPAVVCLSSLFRMESSTVQVVVGTSRGEVYFSSARLDSIQREAELICAGQVDSRVVEVQLSFSDAQESLDCFNGEKKFYASCISVFVRWADARVAVYRMGRDSTWTQVLQIQPQPPFIPLPSYTWSPQMSQLAISGVPDKGVIFCHVSRRSESIKHKKTIQVMVSGLAIRVFREMRDNETSWDDVRMDSSFCQKWIGEYRVAKPPIEMRPISVLNFWVLVVQNCLRVVQFRMPASDAPAAIKVESVLIGHSRPIYRVNSDGFSRFVSISLDEQLIIWDLRKLTKLSHIDLAAPPPPLTEDPLQVVGAPVTPTRSEESTKQSVGLLHDSESFPALPSETVGSHEQFSPTAKWRVEKKLGADQRGNKYVEDADGCLVVSPEEEGDGVSFVRERRQHTQEDYEYEIALAASLEDIKHVEGYSRSSGSEISNELIKEMASAEGMSVSQWLQAQGVRGRDRHASRKDGGAKLVSLLSLHATQAIDIFEDKQNSPVGCAWLRQLENSDDRKSRRRMLRADPLGETLRMQPIIRRAVDYVFIDSESIALYYSSLCAWQLWRFHTDRHMVAKQTK